MTEKELDLVVAALVAGKQLDMYGADGEWGIVYEGGRFRIWTHDPSVEVADRFADEAGVRADLAPFDYATILARLH